MIGRRMLLAIILAVVPFSNGPLVVLCVLAALALFLVVQVRVRPFAARIENAMMTTVDIVLFVSYLGAYVFSEAAGTSERQDWFAYVLIVANALLGVTLVLLSGGVLLANLSERSRFERLRAFSRLVRAHVQSQEVSETRTGASGSGSGRGSGSGIGLGRHASARLSQFAAHQLARDTTRQKQDAARRSLALQDLQQWDGAADRDDADAQL